MDQCTYSSGCDLSESRFLMAGDVSIYSDDVRLKPARQDLPGDLEYPSDFMKPARQHLSGGRRYSSNLLK